MCVWVGVLGERRWVEKPKAFGLSGQGAEGATH